MNDINKTEIQGNNKFTKKRLKNIPITYYLVAINILVFIGIHITNVLISDNWFVYNFAKITYNISINKEYYRLFTSTFMHQSITHLLFNCSAIIILGKPIEAIFGKSKLLLIFIIAGLFGSLSSFIFSSSISIGSSGGVFGYFGVHLYLFLKKPSKYKEIFGRDMLILLVLNVIIGFSMPNIDFYAHFGGILGGFLISLSLGYTHTIKINKSLIVYSIITIVLFSSLFLYFNNEYIKFDEFYIAEVENANIALSNGNLQELIISRDNIINNQPLFLERPDVENILNQIDDFILKLQN